MDARAISERLSAITAPDALNEWELEEQAATIAALPAGVQEGALHHYQAIWPVSHALAALFLHHLPGALECLAPQQLGEWARAALDAYERHGLHGADTFLAEPERNFLCRLRGESALTFTAALPRLRPYIQALAGPLHDLDLTAAPHAATDTATFFLPREIGLFREERQNFLLYKLITSLLWAQVATGTYRWRWKPEEPLIADLAGRYAVRPDPDLAPLLGFFRLFPQPTLAEELFAQAETARLLAFLRRELPGLMDEVAPLLPLLLPQRSAPPETSAQTATLEEIRHFLCHPSGPAEQGKQTRAILLPLASPTSTAADSARATARLYEVVTAFPGPRHALPPLPFVAALRPAEAQAARGRHQQEERTRFVAALSTLLPPAVLPETGITEDQTPPAAARREADTALLPPGTAEAARPQPTIILDKELKALTVDNQSIALPPELQRLGQRIAADLGQVPPEYVAAAAGLAGSGYHPRASATASDDTVPPATPLTYDEWDFRRNGFRKEWCLLHEKDILPTRGTFIETVSQKHRGLLLRLRRQFEMMRPGERFVRRQRDGDDLDLDAIVEALADAKAGQAPSERLFIRLRRDQRQIAVVFLVDMSSSTQGWVNTAIKESLFLMCEALAVLGDAYAIYGFSGMRRLRSELYHVKHLDEPYNDLVKAKIAAIAPQEYTRMGPPLRHVTRLLTATEARARLLITLSDGKPEDYDDYKGDYAIEDTRHALIEAKNLGIHPFCITIDQQAHDYIAHMYGEVNYIVINDVRNLPNRMPEIYRTLTG
ncbi:MAG: VWA domain-containing protein [Thermodesulfobacteriota bacterium]